MLSQYILYSIPKTWRITCMYFMFISYLDEAQWVYTGQRNADKNAFVHHTVLVINIYWLFYLLDQYQWQQTHVICHVNTVTSQINLITPQNNPQYNKNDPTYTNNDLIRQILPYIYKQWHHTASMTLNIQTMTSHSVHNI